jgi:hypothetical protein
MHFIIGSEPLSSLVAEEKVIFGLNAKAISQLTLAKIRKVYSRADNKSIAKQVNFLIIIRLFNKIAFNIHTNLIFH